MYWHVFALECKVYKFEKIFVVQGLNYHGLVYECKICECKILWILGFLKKTQYRDFKNPRDRDLNLKKSYPEAASF